MRVSTFSATSNVCVSAGGWLVGHRGRDVLGSVFLVDHRAFYGSLARLVPTPLGQWGSMEKSKIVDCCVVGKIVCGMDVSGWHGRVCVAWVCLCGMNVLV